ncbi:universal stress protein [Actinoplanes sp. N902-109]|uniref:universal stress protein n=1 Tax=Actinoplanes sp. (strain N902-109) TaxID=649831 RepID=UPI0003293954|nr:universal stress protein [Actinoplanes sp. N902-109]AGL17141.1 UspA domain-containing protein [Actinoplanes sp. N902-109]
MSDLDKYRTEREARLGSRGNPQRRGPGINGYLGSSGSGAGAATAAPAEHHRRAGRSADGVVVVGVEEGPSSYPAVDQAAVEAALRGWKLRLVHVQRAGAGRHPEPTAGSRLLERLEERVHACSPAVPVSTRLVSGPAVPTLLDEARDATLLVVGHQHGAAAVLGGAGVGDRVAAQHNGPVLVVRVPGWPPGPDPARRPVVAGVAAVRRSTAAAGFALAEARARGCDLILLHAERNALPGDRTETVDGVRIRHRALPADPAQALIEASGRAAAVVVGRHGPTSLPGALLGPVSRAMVRGALCPVFLVG